MRLAAIAFRDPTRAASCLGAVLTHAQTSALEPGAAPALESLRRQEERTRDQQRELQPHADAFTPAASGARAT